MGRADTRVWEIGRFSDPRTYTHIHDAQSLTAAAALAARGSRPNSPAPGQAPFDSGAGGASSSGGSGAGGGSVAPSAAAAAPFFLHTFESAVQYLIALFLKANSSTSNSSSAAAMTSVSSSAASSSGGALGSGPLNRAGIAAALVAFLRRHRGHLAREDTLQWLLGVLLSAVARPGRAQAALKEDMGARAGVAHILQAGLCTGAPEQVGYWLLVGDLDE